MGWRATVAIAAALLLLVNLPAGEPLRSGHAAASERTVASLTAQVLPIPTGSQVTPVPTDHPIRLTLTLDGSNASRLSAFLSAVESPGSAEYRRFLTSSEYLEEFGPAPSTVREVEAALVEAGATSVAVAPGGLSVIAEMLPTTVTALLGVHLVAFHSSGGVEGYTANGSPALPASLRGLVTGIDGLSGVTDTSGVGTTLTQATPLSSVRSAGGQFVQGDYPGDSDWYFGSDYTQAYNATALFPGADSVAGATFPTGVAIATLLASGYDAATNTTLPPWDPTVVDDYFRDTFPSSWPRPTLTGVPVNESGAPLPPAPGPVPIQNDSTGYVTENSLDLEMAGSLAPGSALYNFYVSGELSFSASTSVLNPQYFADELGAALTYNYSGAQLAVVSCSFGISDLNDSAWDAELEMAAAMGVTVVAASGDQGDAPGSLTGRGNDPWPLWPASAAFDSSGAIAVGGVSATLAGVPTSVYTGPPLQPSFDPNVTGFSSVTAWWDTLGGPGDYAGSEGGLSLVYAEPSWQFHSAAQSAIVAAAETQGTGSLGRAEPDVAFAANLTIAYVWVDTNGTPYFEVLGGTSVAAPTFAGLLADVVAVENATVRPTSGLGFLDPELYRIASYYAAHAGPSDPFLDVTTGSNYLFSAGPGWDAVTGWGGLSAPKLLAADENPTVANYTYTGPTPGLPVAAPPLTAVELVIVLSAAAVTTIAAGVLLARRTHRTPAPVLPPSPVLPPTAFAAGVVRPPTMAFTTFLCPYCGAERPSEPVRCPACGAM